MQGPVHIVHTTLLTIYNTVYWRYETEWFDRKFPPPMSAFTAFYFAEGTQWLTAWPAHFTAVS